MVERTCEESPTFSKPCGTVCNADPRRSAAKDWSMLTADTKDSELKALGLQFLRMGDFGVDGKLSATSYVKVTGVDDSKLTMLHIEHLSNTIILPREIGLMTELIQLKISGLSPSAFASLSPLRGCIPTEIGLLTKLEVLHLRDTNWLTGPIPEELGQLSNTLYDMQLQNNDLTGTIPEWVCDMELKALKLSFNRLSGTVPNCLSTGRIANHVTGVKKSSLAYQKKTWTGLRYLHLSANDLTGAFPDLSGQKDPAFKEVHLETNLFEGTYVCGTAKEILAMNKWRRNTDPKHRCTDRYGETLAYSQDPLWRQGRTGSFEFEGDVWDAGLLPYAWDTHYSKNRRNYVGQGSKADEEADIVRGGNRYSSGNKDVVFIGNGNIHGTAYKLFYRKLTRPCRSSDPNYATSEYCAYKYVLNAWTTHPLWWCMPYQAHAHDTCGTCPRTTWGVTKMQRKMQRIVYHCDPAKYAEDCRPVS